MSDSISAAMDVSVAEMKREHNAMIEEGRKLYGRLGELTEKVNAIRETIKRVAPDEHDEVLLLFGGVYEE